MSSDNSYTWHPVLSNVYVVSGTSNEVGAIGKPDNFKIETQATSARNAYIEVRDGLYNNKREHVHVIAIKMKCTHCGEAHVTVPPDLYLD